MTRRLLPLDVATLAYGAFAAVALIAKGASGPTLGFSLVGLAGLMLLAWRAPELRERSGLLAFVGEFYPLLALYLLYRQVGLLNLASGVSHDALVQGWELELFGSQPSRAWIESQPWPWLSNLLHFGYLSYYLILVSAPLGPWISGNREGARRVTLAVMATFYSCYAIFLAFPVAGPRYAFPSVSGPGAETLLAGVTHRLLEGGSAWGTAFPSSHVAASLVATAAAGRESRPLGAVLGVLALLLSLGTVYGGFHYAVDALAGVLVAALALAWTSPRGRHSLPAGLA